MKKLKRIKVSTPEGEKYITYRPIDEVPTDGLICDLKCPYGKVCSELPHPVEPDNDDVRYTDFCNSIGESDGNEDLSTMVPNEGELENLFKDKKFILQKIIKKNPIYELNKIIDTCCPGICDLYTKDHCNCTLENKMCILRPLFIGPKEKKDLESVKEDNKQ